jgi:gluconate kinase
VTSKEAFEFMFGQHGINDVGIKIWEAAIQWERCEMIDAAKRYKQRNDHIMKKTAADSFINTLQRRIKNDRAV